MLTQGTASEEIDECVFYRTHHSNNSGVLVKYMTTGTITFLVNLCILTI